jgi:hypothetical protein
LTSVVRGIPQPRQHTPFAAQKQRKLLRCGMRRVTGDTAAGGAGRAQGGLSKGSPAMVPIVQFSLILVLAAAPVLVVTAWARPARRSRGGDPVAFPLRRGLG